MVNPTAAMLVIGDDILSGRTRAANAHPLAVELAAPVGLAVGRPHAGELGMLELVERGRLERRLVVERSGQRVEIGRGLFRGPAAHHGHALPGGVGDRRAGARGGPVGAGYCSAAPGAGPRENIGTTAPAIEPPTSGARRNSQSW